MRTANGHDRASLLERVASRMRRPQTDEQSIYEMDASDVIPVELSPIRLGDALAALTALCDVAAPREMLLAAMPLIDGDLDPRFAPIALARAGLEARWEQADLVRMDERDFPVLAVLKTGGCAILTARTESGDFQLRDAVGEHIVDLQRLKHLIDASVLLCGHVDPCNGLKTEEELDLSRRNPRLWLLGLFLGEKRQIKHLLAAAVFMNITALAVPFYTRAIYDRVVPNLAMESLWALSIGVVLVLIFELVLKKVRGSFIDAVGTRVGQSVQHRAMSAVLRARAGSTRQGASGMMNALRDVETLALTVPQAIVVYAIDIPFFFAYLALIALIGGWTVAGPIVGGGTLLIVGMVCSHAVKLVGKRSSRLMQARNDLVVDVSVGLETIKANRAEGRMLRQWDIVSDHIGMSTEASRKWNETPLAASGFVAQFVTIMVIVIGVMQIKEGMMTTGALVALTMLCARAMYPITNAISVTARLYQALAQIAGLAEILALAPERDVSDPSIRREVAKGEIGLRGVMFHYPGAGEPSVNGMSLQIRQGEKIAVIGKSGSGKSTLLRVLAGLIEPSEGIVTLNGHALNQYAPAHLRQSLSFTAQDAALFNCSIWENILLGIEEPPSEIVEAAIKLSGLDSFVARSVEGYSRKAGPNGSHLSGGQRQAVLLARAFIRDPQILLLDEPTASMDINGERGVIEGLRRFAEDSRTLIVATHRMALLDIVDRVIWLDDGKIIADRSKQDVLAMMRNQAQQQQTQAA